MTDPWTPPQATPAFGSPRGTVGVVAQGGATGWRADPHTEGQLRLWDGRQWTEHVRPVDFAPEATTAWPARTNDGVRAWALIGQLMLSLTVVTSCVFLLWSISTLNTVQIWSMQPGGVQEAEARALLRTMILILVALLIVSFLSLVFVFVWVGVARNDRNMNRALLRGSMVGTVFGSFVPGLNIRIAWRTLTDLYQGSDPRRAGHRPTTASRAAPPLVAAFCVLYFFPSTIQLLALARIQQALGTVDQVRDVIFALIISTALGVAATLCLILVITRVTDHLRGRGGAPGTETARPVARQLTRI